MVSAPGNCRAKLIFLNRNRHTASGRSIAQLGSEPTAKKAPEKPGNLIGVCLQRKVSRREQVDLGIRVVTSERFGAGW